MYSNKNFITQVFLFFIVIAFFVFLIWSLNGSPRKDKETERLRRLDELKREKDILLSHQRKTINLEKKLKEASDKFWKKLVRSVLFIFLILASPFIFIYGFSIIDFAFNLFSYVFISFCIIYFLITMKFFSMKEQVYDKMQGLVYKEIVGYRDAEYFAEKHETIEDRLEQLDLEIKQLSNR